MARKSPEDAALDAVRRIQENMRREIREEIWAEAFQAGWEACAEKVAKAAEPPASVPRALMPSRQTSKDVYKRFINSSWPSDISEETQIVKIDDLGLPIRVYNILLRGFEERFSYFPQTVGDIIEKLTPREVIDLADYRNPLGEKSVEQLTEAFAGIGVVLQPND